MEINIPIPVKGFKEQIVGARDTAARYGSGLVEVFATPAMIGLMEGTCMESVNLHLPEGAITLGIEVNVKHLKATPMGMKVSCYSKLVKVEGKKLFFEVRAEDEDGVIGTGFHLRYIVDGKAFMESLKA